MILYFSGTGNCKFAAEQLASRLGDPDLVSMNECMKTGAPAVFRADNRPIVIVSPIYISRMPLEVENYLLTCAFEGDSKDVYFLFTCAGGMGGAARWCRILAASLGLNYRGTGCLVLPSNYVVLMNVAGHEKAEAKAREALPELDRIAGVIRDGQVLTAPKKLQSAPWSSAMAPFFHGLLIHDGPFHSTEACVGCGKCERVCPMNNIRLNDHKRPEWKGRCMHCMACISYCPAEAIEFGFVTRGRNRYHL